jgi:uncharacterized membrane protein YphA (DoxX/SURF4 family)
VSLNVNEMTTKTKNIIAWVLVALLAFAFAGSGISKVIGVEMQIKNLESWGYPLWLRFPIGLSEIAFAITLLIPRFRKITIYGIFAWTIVAVITHLQAGQAGMIIPSIVLGIIAAIIFWLTKEKNAHQ